MNQIHQGTKTLLFCIEKEHKHHFKLVKFKARIMDDDRKAAFIAEAKQWDWNELAESEDDHNDLTIKMQKNCAT